jgi:S1 RNA binding domain protein
MELAIGTVYEGKVTGITKFGAFIALPEGKTGMVHISEIANSYVNDIREHLAENQQVKVKVIGIDGAGRINLSIKKALTREQQVPQPALISQARQDSYHTAESFEDKLNRFMQDSKTKMSDSKLYADKKTSRRRTR